MNHPTTTEELLVALIEAAATGDELRMDDLRVTAEDWMLGTHERGLVNRALAAAQEILRELWDAS